MNRRRFLGNVAAIAAALGVTRVPDSVQAAAFTDRQNAEAAYGPLYSTDQLNQIRDAIAQARADGYNRGREVEAARMEARSDPHAHCGPDCDQWRDLLQWDWANPAAVTRSGSFVSGRGEMVVTYHEPVRPA